MTTHLNIEKERRDFGVWLREATDRHENDATQQTPEPDMFGAWLAARRVSLQADEGKDGALAKAKEALETCLAMADSNNDGISWEAAKAGLEAIASINTKEST